MRFDLDTELTKYLLQLRNKQHIHRLALEEIELHLRDGIESKIDSGSTEQEAFNATISEFGDVQTVAREFAILTENKRLTKFVNRTSYYFDREVIMRIFSGVILGMCFILIGTALEGGHLSGMIGLRPLAMVLGGALGGLVIAYPIQSIKNAMLLAFTGRSASKNNYLQAASIFKSYGELLVLSSGVTIVIGINHALANLATPQNIGAGIAVGVLGVLYCLLTKLFVCKPLYDSFLRRAEVSTEVNLFTGDKTKPLHSN